MTGDYYMNTVHPYVANLTTGTTGTGYTVVPQIQWMTNSGTTIPYQAYYTNSAVNVTTNAESYVNRWPSGFITSWPQSQTWTWSGTGITAFQTIDCTGRRTRADRLRDLIRRRSGPAIIVGRRDPAATEFDEREERARDTLRRVVGDDQYRRFLKHGFVSLKAKSGRVYCVYPGHQQTLVYQGGRMIEILCVVLRGQFPPTDVLITRYLMLLNDEAGFRKIANVSSGYYRPIIPSIKARNLLEEIAQDPILRRVG